MSTFCRSLLAISVSLLFSASGLADTSTEGTVYAGTIGTSPVVVKLTAQGGTYFYTSHGQSIELTRRQVGSALLLQEHPLSALDQGDTQTSTGSMRLTSRASGWAGTWKAASRGSSLAVRLSPAAITPLSSTLVGSPEFQRWQREDLFNYLRLNHSWSPGTANADSSGLPVMKEPLSGVVYPRIPGQSAVNATLQDLQAQDALDALDCQASAPNSGSLQEAWAVQTQVTRRSGALLSLKTTGTAFCGGAHPADIAATKTLDTRTGQPVNVRALFAGLTDAQLRSAYLASYPKSNSSCAEAVSQLLTQTPDPLTPTLFLSNSGVSLWLPDLPHVAFACNAEVTLSFASVKAGFRGNSVILADLYR